MCNLESCNKLETSDDPCMEAKGVKETHVSICNATPGHIPQICAISGSATKKFGTIKELRDLAEDQEEPAQIQQWLDQGKICLAICSGEPLGFIAAYSVDDAVYIAEASVLESAQGKGIGGRLVDAVTQWAVEKSMEDGSKLARVSLTTYADVSWNGRWYAKRGFKEVDPAVVGPQHVELVADDRQKLERPGYRRCCMLWEHDLSP